MLVTALGPGRYHPGGDDATMEDMRLTEDLRGLASRPDFRTLMAVRLSSQAGDGMLQVGLASLLLFRAEHLTDVEDVAAALVVMLLPFSLVGPLTGPLVDRWRRRQLLLRGNLARAALVLATAAALQGAGGAPLIHAMALVSLGAARFLLAVLSAGLPRTVEPERLLVANSIVPALGGAAAAIGALIGLVLRLILPGGSAQETAGLIAAALLYCAAAALVTRLAPDHLGPERAPRGAGAAAVAAQAPSAAPAALAGEVVGDLIDAVGHLVRRATPALALSAMALHRFVHGMQLVVVILVARNLLARPQDADAGLAAFAALMGGMLAGHGLAVPLTALAHGRLRPATWVVLCLLAGTAGQAVLVATHAREWMVAGLVLFGLGVQGAKIAVDTIVQADTDDAYRGRAFAIYDMLFNSAECAAAVLAVLVLPPTGWSRGVQTALLVMVWVVAALYGIAMRMLGGRPLGARAAGRE